MAPNIDRKARKARRVKLLNRERQITFNHCNPCTTRKKSDSQGHKAICEGCPFYLELRAIGEELSPTSEYGKIAQNRKLTGHRGRPRKYNYLFTLEKYRELIKTHSRKEICQIYGISMDELIRQFQSLSKLESRKRE